MRVRYRKAKKEDAELLINLYNASFYKDYVKYGECPAYGKSKQEMETSIALIPKILVLCDHTPVGVISAARIDKGVYHIGCLCIIPAYQGQGIGTQALRHLLNVVYPDWRRFTFITPADKTENIKFYTEKCGFRIGSRNMDGQVPVVGLYKERQTPLNE